jgi:acetyl-CoA synthetase
MRRFGRCYVEEMVGGALAELIVGVAADPQFGLALTVGAGGIWVELLADSVTVLLPASREEFRSALVSLRAFALLEGHRGRARADLERVLDAMVAIAAFAEDHAGELLELDINPLIVTEREAIAVDALVCLRASTGALGGEGNEPPARH